MVQANDAKIFDDIATLRSYVKDAIVSTVIASRLQSGVMVTTSYCTADRIGVTEEIVPLTEIVNTP